MKSPFRCLILFTLAALFLTLCEVQAQSRTVSGRVTDEKDGTPVPGVTVTVKNTTVATQTNENGQFSLSAGSENDVLVFSFIGYESREVRVGNQSVINVSLTGKESVLDEVVVVGYGTMKRSEVTSSVATVTAKDFNPGGVRSPLDLIQGKVAGLTISRPQGNNPNSGAAIQLRGVTSISGSQQPLIVIDGIPGGSLDLLQQDDIQSFDVLKDGSAAAIYGTQANAGVIIVTTKRAKGGPPHFDYSTYAQREYIDKKPDYLTAKDFRDLISQGLINSSQDFGSDTDLFEELIDRDNISQYHLLASSGGNENNNYRASVYFNEANGIAKQNGRKQFGGRINVFQRGFHDKLTFNANIAFNFNKANLLGGGTSDFEQAVQRNPTAPLVNEDGSFVETQAYNNYNPLSRLANRISERDQQTMSADAKLTYKIIENLDFSTFVSYVRNNYNDRFYRSTKDWDQRPNSEYQGMAYAEKANSLDFRRNLESILNYRKELDDRHTLSGLLGYSYLYVSQEGFGVNNNGFTTDGFLDWNLGAGGAINNTTLPRPGMSSGKEDNTLIAFFGRVNYSFANKYFAQAVLRREGSSRFGDNHKWGNFPAFSVGWHIAKEEFMQNQSLISNLKLRVGYGVTGNQGIPNYQSLITLGTGGVWPQNGVILPDLRAGP
ncbi:MAG: SusC/RagA family TonB-linked outer membrane protein [Leadbetterella sp.]|nr:SusC/RagA family TonB-linked outer membrane protein [Leadbetterella sp.]